MIRLLLPYRGNATANIRVENEAAADKARLAGGFAPDKPIWSGTLDAASLDSLLESPARKELAKRILEGESVIWCIVVGEKPEDTAAAERIQKRLKFLEQVVQLPPQDPNDPDSQLGPGPPLKLKLTTLRVKRDDPAEKLFCAMLAGPKCADALAKGEAFAAPVFGRGRVLGAWRVADLDEAAIEDATIFLTGRCSCRVKNQSPGWDVLLNVDWDHALEKASKATAAGSNPRQNPQTAAPRATTTTPKSPAADEHLVATSALIDAEGLPWKRAAIIGGTALGVLGGSVLWIKR
jgi:hypothetical protein